MPKTSKKSAAKSKGPRVNKSAWIRDQAPNLSAKEVVEKAKGEGIKLSLAQVYTARSTAKRHGEPKRGPGAPAGAVKRGPGRPKLIGPSNGDLRRQFVALAVRIGTDEAQRLLDRVVDVQTPSR
jgi:hypothetical protein